MVDVFQAQMLLLLEDDDERQHFNYDKIVEQQNLSKKKRKKMMKKGEELLEQDHFQVKPSNVSTSLRAFGVNGVSSSPGGRQRPSFPGHVHLPPVQPGPLPPQLQEQQSHAEHPGREAAAATAAGPGGGPAPSRSPAPGGQRRGPSEGDHGAEPVSAGQIHQEQDGRVSEPQETEADAGLILIQLLLRLLLFVYIHKQEVTRTSK